MLYSRVPGLFPTHHVIQQQLFRWRGLVRILKVRKDTYIFNTLGLLHLLSAKLDTYIQCQLNVFTHHKYGQSSKLCATAHFYKCHTLPWKTTEPGRKKKSFKLWKTAGFNAETTCMQSQLPSTDLRSKKLWLQNLSTLQFAMHLQLFCCCS